MVFRQKKWSLCSKEWGLGLKGYVTNSKIKDEEDVKLLDAIGLKSLPSIWVTPLRKTGKGIIPKKEPPLLATHVLMKKKSRIL